MPAQLLPLRLLPSGRVPRGAFSILVRAFPFRLKYLVLASAAAPGCGPTARAFSSRAARSVGGPRERPRGDFRAAGQGRSLVEDEAELSDWVSELRTDSLRLGLSSEGQDEDSGRDRSRNSRGRNGDSETERDRGSLKSFRDKGGSSSSKRARESEFDARRSRFGSRNRFGSDLEEEKEEEEEDDDEEIFRSRKRRGRDGRGGISSRREGRDIESGYRHGRGGISSRREGRDIESGYRHGRGGISSRREGRDTESGYRHGRGGISSRREGRDTESGYRHGRGGISSRREGRDIESGYRHGGGGISSRREGRDIELGYRHGRGAKKPAFDVLQEEDKDESDEEEDEISGFEDDFFGDREEMKGGVKNVFASNSSAELDEGDSTPPVTRKSEGQSDSYLSQTRFDQCSISPLSLKGIKTAGYETMTVVQEATLPVILKGKDVLAKAKTGTGKTVAFLLPAIEVVAKLPPADRDQKRPPINVLVICPTRELASQAAAEAETLLKYHPSIGVQVVIGGTRLALEQKRMQANPCQILVATPGRLRDHLENTPGFATRLMGVKVLVLDEADRLLDMGFRKDIEKIVAAVPKQRQTLLFSATVPDEVRQICYIALKRDHEFINTVQEGSEETHTQVTQMHLVAPLEKHFSILYGILTDHIAEDVDYKVIVFCTTAMVTKLVADLLSELHLNVREIHSRKPQSYRTRVSKEFKESKGLILVSSDVSARGVDYPDVTLVIQVGVPTDREQYIHRLGRTGRKGKEGKGILMLAPWEQFFLSSIKNLPITNAPLPLIDPDIRKKVERALAHVEMKNKESAYQAWLGYYNSNKNVGQDKFRLVALANEFSCSMGLDNPPAIPKLVLRKMGLNNVPGLRSK